MNISVLNYSDSTVFWGLAVCNLWFLFYINCYWIRVLFLSENLQIYVIKLMCVRVCEQILAPSMCLWSGAAVSLCLQEIQSNISQLKELQNAAATQVSITNTYALYTYKHTPIQPRDNRIILNWSLCVFVCRTISLWMKVCLKCWVELISLSALSHTLSSFSQQPHTLTD